MPGTRLGFFSLARLRKYFGNRRGSLRLRSRREVRLTAGVSFGDSEETTLISHTLNLSEGGLSLFVQQMNLDKFDTAGGQELSVMLSLPGRAVSFTAAARSVRPFEEGRPESGHVVGVRITRMGDIERGHLRAFLRESR